MSANTCGRLFEMAMITYRNCSSPPSAACNACILFCEQFDAAQDSSMRNWKAVLRLYSKVHGMLAPTVNANSDEASDLIKLQ